MKNKIIVYSKPNCAQCRQTKMFLESLELDFVEKDIIADESAYNEVVEMGLMRLPVVVVPGQETFTGFRPDLLEKLV